MKAFFKKHAAGLQAAALTAMLLIPFLLYKAAMDGSDLLVKVLLGVMAANMLFVMKKG